MNDIELRKDLNLTEFILNKNGLNSKILNLTIEWSGLFYVHDNSKFRAYQLEQ